MRYFQILVIIFLSCGTSKSRVDNNTQQAEEYKFDTISIGDLISKEAQSKRDSLQVKDTIAYGRFMLKQFAYCNCLYEALRNDTFFIGLDHSNGLLSRDMVIHTHDASDSIRGYIKKYITWVNNTSNPFGAKNYSLFCLELYESKYLDSLIKSYDSKIIK